jgi:hypothetical protein
LAAWHAGRRVAVISGIVSVLEMTVDITDIQWTDSSDGNSTHEHFGKGDLCVVRY